MLNPLFLIDGYKLDHRRQYPAGTTRVYSNFTPRESRIDGVNEVVFLGLQLFIKKYLEEAFDEFFCGEEHDTCAEYARRVNGYLGPNSVGVEHIAALQDLGYLPIVIRALPEGTLVPLRVPMLTIENTHPDFAWLPNYLETLLSSVLWGPCTSATTALRFRRLLSHYARDTGSPEDFVQWQGHDFSFRGMMGPEAACLSGIGHLLSFTGTDTIPAIETIEEYYGPLPEGYLVGGSVAATEHSVMCAGGEGNELETISRLLDLYPTGVLSVVSDTWDFWHVVTVILPQLKDKIMARDGKLVIRPDSGDPVKIICGDPEAEIGSRQYLGVVQCLWDIFGGTVTDELCCLLDPHIGVIYGDSITYERAEAILEGLDRDHFASGNVVLGIGSYTYQYVTRDTFGFAMKATWVEINGEGHAISKAPKTGNGMKNSAKGRLAVCSFKPGELTLVEGVSDGAEGECFLARLDQMREVWRDGSFVTEETFDVIRARLLARV